MAVSSSGNIAKITSSVVIGGFLCLSIILFAIAATVVLSLISIYTPDHSEEGYGEKYRINALLLKALYQDNKFEFNNGIIADSVALSTLCGSMYRTQGEKSFAGCLAQNFRAFGPYNNSNTAKRRRRASPGSVGLYEIGETTLYYSTSCLSKADRLKYGNSSILSNCVRKRLKTCNGFVNGSSTFNPWTPLPTPFSQAIVDKNAYGYQITTVQNLYTIPFPIALSLAGSLNLPDITKQYLRLGCQYIGPVPQSEIAANLAAQATETTTQPTSSNAPVG